MDDIEARADYEAEMARDSRDWASLTEAEREAIILDQEVAAMISSERRAEMPMSMDFAWR